MVTVDLMDVEFLVTDYEIVNLRGNSITERDEAL